MPLQLIGLVLWIQLLPGEAFMSSGSNSYHRCTSSTTSFLTAEIPKKQQQQHLQQLTPDQQEQLDKYGATPETSMEILLDQLMGDDGSSSNDFLEASGADEEARGKWQSFIDNMRQIKEGQNLRDGEEEQNND